MKEILIVCGNGLGSSMMLEISVKKVLSDAGVAAKVGHTDLASAKSMKADIFVGTKEILVALEDGKRLLVAIKNIVDKKEIQEALLPHMQ